MSQEARAAASDWLLQESFVDRPSDWPETFIDLFDAVFSEDHFSWTCFWRSAAISVTTVIVISSVLWISGVFSKETFLFKTSGDISPSVEIQLLSVFLVVIFYNLFFDYFSLLETRYILNYLPDGSFSFRFAILILDILATLFVICLGFILSEYLLQLIFNPKLDYIPSFSYVKSLAYAPIRAISQVYPFGNAPATPMAYSTFATSVWIWAYILSGYIIKVLYHFFEGVYFMRSIFNIRGRPVHSMGILISVFMSVVFALSAPFVL